MKKIILIICVLVHLFGCTQTKVNLNSKSGDTNVQNEVDKSLEIIPYTKEGLEKLLNEIELNEPSVKGKYFDKENIELYIAVSNDGTNRDGLAEYYCQLCKDFDVSAKGVYITEYKYRDPKSFDMILGESNCKF